MVRRLLGTLLLVLLLLALLYTRSVWATGSALPSNNDLSFKPYSYHQTFMPNVAP